MILTSNILSDSEVHVANQEKLILKKENPDNERKNHWTLPQDNKQLFLHSNVDQPNKWKQFHIQGNQNL